MNKNIHKHLNAVTEFVAFCFLSVLVLLGGISVITVQAEYAGGGSGDESGGVASPACIPPYAVNGTTQCNYDLCPKGCEYIAGCPVGCATDATNDGSASGQCPAGYKECPGYGCYPINASCPGNDNDNAAPSCNAGYYWCADYGCLPSGTSCPPGGGETSNTNEIPIPPTCTSDYAVAGTHQCNYALCPGGCSYGLDNCPTDCLADNTNDNSSEQCPTGYAYCQGYGCLLFGSPCPPGNQNQNSNENANCQTGYYSCPGYGCYAAGVSCPDGNTSGSQSGESDEKSLLVMKGVIKNVGSAAAQLTILNSDTGASWQVITTEETIFSLNEQPSVFATLAPQQAIKIYYSIYFEDEHLLVAKGIATLNYSPSNDQPPSNPTDPSNDQPESVATPATGTIPQPRPGERVNYLDPYPIPVVLEEDSERLLISQLSDDEQKKFSAHCKEYGVTTITACRALIAENLDPACREAGATRPDECDYILRERHAAEYCATRTITNPETCRKFIIAEHKNELNCGNLDAVTCRERSETVFIGHIAAGITAREAVTEAINIQEPEHIAIPQLTDSLRSLGLNPTIIPLQPDTPGSYLVVPSEKFIDVSSDVVATISIPYVLIPDADGDGLSNDLENLYGTDPNAADTDSDGFSDATEIHSGHDPLSTGGPQRIRELQDTERALLNKVALEQPLYHGTADALFTIEPVPPLAETKGVTLRGTAEPNALILIYLYSKLPMVLTVKTDEFGNWVYDLQESLVEDRHTIYIAVTDKTGRITKKSNPLSFVVNPAIAVTRTTFLTDEQVPKTQSSTNFGIYYMAGGALLIAAALIFIIAGIVNPVRDSVSNGVKRTNRNA